MVRRRVLAIRPAGDVLLGGASGASSLLLNTKASQEVACSRAPAAIVPGRVPSHTAHTWKRRMPERAMRDGWKVQVAAEMPE